jgi:hypothetical protein
LATATNGLIDSSLDSIHGGPEDATLLAVHSDNFEAFVGRQDPRQQFG